MKMVRFLLALLVGLGLHLTCSAQNDTVRVQRLHSQKQQKNLYKVDSTTRKRHDPRRATLYSTFFPGLGQFYNRKYWKIPIVWAAVGIPAYTYFNNRSWYQKCQKAISLLDIYTTLGKSYPGGDSLKLVDPKLQVFMTAGDENSLRTYRNEFRKDEDYSVLFFLLFWGLNIVDATVDAHLMYFDVSNSLTLHLQQPSGNVTLMGPAGPGMGLSLVLDWHKPQHGPNKKFEQ
ncbi:MAG TPA: DUF5683 domain-containing protein [Puia sp.]|jgi:hypothetical protein|nr:DUF5683 domain-containing protein [Puia sp.]